MKGRRGEGKKVRTMKRKVRKWMEIEGERKLDRTWKASKGEIQ